MLKTLKLKIIQAALTNKLIVKMYSYLSAEKFVAFYNEVNTDRQRRIFSDVDYRIFMDRVNSTAAFLRKEMESNEHHRNSFFQNVFMSD